MFNTTVVNHETTVIKEEKKPDSVQYFADSLLFGNIA